MGIAIWLHIELDTGNEPYTVTLFHDNITHNVAPMWKKAGVYEALYESEGKQGKDILSVLKAGVLHMEMNPEKYIILNPINLWGSYPAALGFLQKFASACEAYPNAIIMVSK